MRRLDPFLTLAECRHWATSPVGLYALAGMMRYTKAVDTNFGCVQSKLKEISRTRVNRFLIETLSDQLVGL